MTDQTGHPFGEDVDPGYLNLNPLDLQQHKLWACAQCGTVRLMRGMRPCNVCMLMERLEQTIMTQQSWEGR